MRRRKSLITGVLLLLFMDNVLSVAEWNKPLFKEPNEPVHPNVTYVELDEEWSSGQASIWEGTEGNVELMRLTFKANGGNLPTLTYGGSLGLGLSLVVDDDSENPVYLQATEPGDYDSGTQSVFITLTSPSNTQSDVGSRAYVRVMLENVNDNAPIIKPPLSCKFEEERLYGADDTDRDAESVCEFTVTDADGGACFVTITIDDPHFELRQTSEKTHSCKSATFVLDVVQTLDFERYRLHSLQITVQDDGIISDEGQKINGEEPQMQEITFVVNVIDIPDTDPVWETMVPYMSVTEKVESTTFQFRARDGDYELDWKIEYSLKFEGKNQDYEDDFKIDENGLLNVKYIDRDETQIDIISFQVIATEVVPSDYKDPNFIPQKISDAVVVVVVDVNDNIPKIVPETYSTEVDEETSFTIDFTASDPDLGENGRYNLELQGDEGDERIENFMIIPSTGYQTTSFSITPKNISLLDYEVESWRVITFTILAKEVASADHVGKATITIHLIDLLDEPPEFDQTICSEIQRFEENQKEGFMVVQVIAIDPDEMDTVTYSLKNNYMEVDKETGKVTSTKDNAFDYERQSEIIIQVVAEDTTNLRDFCEVTIELIDINDEPPTIVMPSRSVEVEEHSDPGTAASNEITATDPDKDADLTFKINWSNSVVYKQGVALDDETLYIESITLDDIDLTEGVWSTKLIVADNETFDWEVFDSMRLQIDVIDLDTHEDYEHNKIRSASLTVTVGDKNDCPPIFTEDSVNKQIIVNENVESGRFVGFVVATDDDSAPFSQIEYSIEPLFPEGLLNEPDRITIDKSTGQMYATEEAIDCDEWQELVHQYKVFATDGIHTTDTTIYINIQDENDETPQVVKPVSLEIEIELEEEQERRWEIGCITGLDKDVTENYRTISYFIQGTALNLFEMDENCDRGETCCLYAINGKLLDREQQETHKVEVFSRDNYRDKINSNTNDGPSVMMTLTLIDINDNPPVFETIKTAFEVRENEAPVNFHLFSVQVTDEDIGDNGEIVCEDVPAVTLTYPSRPDVDLRDLFEVKTESDGCAVYTKKDLVGSWGEYTLKLTAWDKGAEPLSGYGIYDLTVINVNLNAPEITFPTDGLAILIGRVQTINGVDPLTQLNGTFLTDFTAIDADDPETPNGQVTFDLTGADSIFYMDPSSDVNTAVLRMWRIPASGERKFSMQLIARDRGTLGSKESDPVNFDVWVLSSVSYPEFTDLEPQIVKFTENTTGLGETATLRAAVNLDEVPLDEDQRRPIYYFMIEGDTDLFKLDKETRELRLLSMLDYEITKEHTLNIFATHSSEGPESVNINDQNVLQIIIQVIDENDEPPRFSQDLFPGTFSAEHKIGQHILDLEAFDPDEDDEMNFQIISGTIKTDDSSLTEFAEDNAFVVGLKTGVITLNFNPNGKVLSGYLEFRVQVYDKAGNVDGHRDEALVNVFVVSESHRVTFNFFNPASAVETRQKEMAETFSAVLGYTCVVEEIVATDNENGAETSDVLTHFIDEGDKSPVPKRNIEDQFLDENTYITLSRNMAELSLSLLGFVGEDSNTKSNSKITTIALAAVCAVLAVLVFVFLMAFIVRTRTLNQRLEKLTSKKFGSQDSGLNRGDMIVPGTNKHALEGSNPVWNSETFGQMFDGLSQSSGDSDLIGIEDNPEFDDKIKIGGTSNPVFQPEPSINPFVMASAPSAILDGPRRTSLNPMAMSSAVISPNDGLDAHSIPGSLAMSLDDIDMPRRISLNPLFSDMNIDLDSVEVDKGPVLENNNFIFQNKGEPSTEL